MGKNVEEILRDISSAFRKLQNAESWQKDSGEMRELSRTFFSAAQDLSQIAWNLEKKEKDER